MKTNERGITLIALVITIIVLLILAGITLQMLLGRSGILESSVNAKEATEIAKEREQVDLAAMAALLKSETGHIEREKFEEELDNVIGKGKYTLEGNGPYTVTYRESGRSYYVDENNINNDGGETTPPTDVFVFDKDQLQVGYLVNYSPDTPESNCQVSASLSGYINDQTIKRQNYTWMILNSNDDGTVDIIGIPGICHSTNIDHLVLNGVCGYNNGVYLLNNLCKRLYSNNSLKSVARSINLEDIKDKINLDPNCNKGVEKTYKQSSSTSTSSFSEDVGYGIPKIYAYEEKCPESLKNRKQY